MHPTSSPVQRHFDQEAARYDAWKKRHWHYYDTLKSLYADAIPPDARVLEVGCGTGDILAHLRASRSLGIDVSPAMIEIARKKYPHIEWRACTAEALTAEGGHAFDVIYLSDVIEHLEDRESTFAAIRALCRPGSKVIIGMANPLWEPLLMFLESMGKKMPEGPHERISLRELDALLARHGFVLERRIRRLLLPVHVPLISNALMAIERLPIIRKLCLVQLSTYAYVQLASDRPR